MRRSIFAIVTVGLLSAGPVLAWQNSAPPAEARPVRERRVGQPSPPPLRGPKIDVTDAPGAAMSFSGEGVARMYRSNLRQYAAILKEMDLSDDQRAQVELIIREYGEVVRAYQEEHAPEMRRLREIAVRANVNANPRARSTDRAPAPRRATDQAPPTRRTDRATDRPDERQPDRVTDRRPTQPTDRATDRPVTRPEPPTDARPGNGERSAPDAARFPVQSKEVREAMERFEAIRKAAPPQEPYMKRLYELLTVEQQAEFDRRVEALREAQAEQQMRRRLAAAGVDPEAMERLDPMKPGGDGRPLLDESELTPQMRERLRRLRAERRRMLENRQRNNPAPPSPDDIEFEEPEGP